MTVSAGGNATMFTSCAFAKKGVPSECMSEGLRGRSVRLDAFAASRTWFLRLAHRLQCINHRVTPSPGKDRRRFQLVTPSRVASGGVFIAAKPRGVSAKHRNHSVLKRRRLD